MRHNACWAFVWALILFDSSCSLAAEAREDELTVNATAGVALDGTTARFAVLDTRAEVTSHVTLGAGLAFVEAGRGYEELQVRAFATGRITLRRWLIENRHMVSLSSGSVTRYRNRLRVVRPGLLGRAGLSVRAFDELFLDLHRGQLIRNNLALGLGAQVGHRSSAELYHVWVDNRNAPGGNYLLAFVTLRIWS